MPVKVNGNGDDVLRISLPQVIQDWPANLRQDVTSLNLGGAQLVVPMNQLEAALKTGLVQFTWKKLCGWLEPPVPGAASRIPADTLLELPLKVIAPLFLARHRPAAAQRKAAAGEEIPDVFGKTGMQAWSVVSPTAPGTAGSASTAPAPAPSDAPAPAPASVSATPGRPAEPAFDLTAIIGPPHQRFSAREIIGHVSRQPGAVGAILAMSDGLMVTSAVPPQVKGEVVAAFLPQIFGRMGQYSRELNMGGLRSISFTVEGGSWQLVKEPNIYLAVLCRQDKTVPLNQLAAISAELSKQQH
jgi:predicted regulator of Ras-like GTPase activity (Roadblock/LC7/MglB family)